jgi:hypothetical protein
MLTLCRDSDYAGDLHELLASQSVPANGPGIIRSISVSDFQSYGRRLSS